VDDTPSTQRHTLHLGLINLKLRDIMIDYMIVLPQYEHELFWRYYDRLYIFLAHCDYCLKKWKLLDTVYEGVNCETLALLEQ